MRTHLIHRPARDIFPPLGGSRVSSYRIDLICPSCRYGFPGPSELGTINPDAVHDHGHPQMEAQASCCRRQPGRGMGTVVPLACRRANGAAYAPQMQSSVCTRNSSGGSRRKLFCRRPTPPRCCSGRCSLQGRSTCAKWMVGRPSPQSPSISRLTLPPETIPSCYRRMRHTEFLPHSGRHLNTFASAEEFLRSNRLDDLSCVIADVQMPGMSGVELQAHLLTQGNHVPFIFFTAFPDERVRAQALRAGAICYLTKPFDGDSLIQGLQAALKKHDRGTRT